MRRRIGISVIALLGLAAVLVYLATALGLVESATPLLRALVFAIGPLAIVGVLRLSEQLAGGTPSPTLKVGTVFLVIAFALFTLMLVVQQTVVLSFHQLVRDAADPARVELLRSAFRLVDPVQLGIDACFDIFYCLGIVLLSCVMIRHRDFGRLLGAFGAVAAGALLALNLATFPHPPSEAGLVDLGPVTGLWWVAVIVQLFRAQR
jgi:hypothetical protein